MVYFENFILIQTAKLIYNFSIASESSFISAPLPPSKPFDIKAMVPDLLQAWWVFLQPYTSLLQNLPYP